MKTPPNSSQSDRFIKAAHELGRDEDEAALKAKLEQITRHKPKGGVPAPPKEQDE